MITVIPKRKSLPREHIINALETMRKEFDSICGDENKSIYEINSSVGYLIWDITFLLGLSKKETERILGRPLTK